MPASSRAAKLKKVGSDRYGSRCVGGQAVGSKSGPLRSPPKNKYSGLIVQGNIAPPGLVLGFGLPVVREAARIGALRPAAIASPWSKYRPPSACAVVKSAARTITARIGAARPKAREAGEEKVAAISDPVSGDRLFRLSCGAEARARGAVLRRPPKMEYTATMKVDATLVMVARRCARGGVRERTGRGSVEASKEESGCDFTRASGRCSRRGDVYPRRGVDCVECCAYDPSSERRT